jgi:DNA-binding NarL/FixJ family response regulator
MQGDPVFPEMARKIGAAGFLLENVHSATLIEAIKAVAEGAIWFPEPELATRHGLSQQQLRVTRYLARGLHYEAIARAMGIEVRTVRFHVEGAMKSCVAKTPAELVSIARQRGWFLLPDTRGIGGKPRPHRVKMVDARDPPA